MRIDPALAALMTDPAPQFGAGEAARGWAEQPAVAPLLDELAGYGANRALADCPGLLRLIEGGEQAVGFARSAAAATAGYLAEAPLTAWPWRHFSNGVLHSVTLAAVGEASLSLALVDGAAWESAGKRQPGKPDAPQLAALQGGMLHAVVVAGGGSGRILRNRSSDPARARIEAERIAFVPGGRFCVDGAFEALALDAIDGLLLTLRLHRRASGDTPARQYDIASGALVHQATSGRGDSQTELMMALLRAMRRTDAAPTLATIARSGTPPARWQALRECLALDSGIGFAALCEVAARAADPLCAPARQLVDRLAAQHPALARLQQELLCPA